jgi:hypothetical protein
MVTGFEPDKWDILKNVRREASRHFRGGGREYLTDNNNELATHSKNKNIRK